MQIPPHIRNRNTISILRPVGARTSAGRESPDVPRRGRFEAWPSRLSTALRAVATLVLVAVFSEEAAAQCTLPTPPGQVLPARVTDIVTVEARIRSLHVSWIAVTGANRYVVQWKSGSEGYDSAREATVSGTSHTITGLTPGIEHTVQVFAATRVNLGTTELPEWTIVCSSAPSNMATGIPQALPPPPPPPPPARVDGVTVTPAVESLIVSWSPVADASGYKVQWRSGEQDYDPTARQARTAFPGYVIPDLTPGTEYTVRVIATRTGASDGRPSEEATGTPLAAAPDQVTGVAVTPDVESLIVSWNVVTGADGYKVQWRSGEQDYDPGSRQATTTGTSYTIPGLTPGTEYTVRVIATRTGGSDGKPSDEATGVPLPRVAVSIADAAGAEGVTVEFPVRLDRPSGTTVTLTWSTEDGTAKAGEDYRAVTNGRLTIRPGDRMGMLRVRLLEDRRVEPVETFRVRLTDATNADVDPRAASGTGTVTDNDVEPARSRALGMVLAGMGRRIAADAVDVVEGRSTRQPAAGQDAADLTDARAHGMDVGGGFRRISAMEWLSLGRFDLPLNRQDGAAATDGTTGWRLWGQGSAGGFEGRPEVDSRMDGEVFGGYVGFDYRQDRDTLLGMAIAHTRGEADYAIDRVTTGAVDLELTSMLPYAHWKPRPDLGIWGLLGVGRGDVTLKDEAGEVEADLEMLMAASGLRQEMTAWRGIDVAVEADAFLIELEAGATRELPKTTGSASRLRLGLEGRRQWDLSTGSQLTPRLEIGGRWDGGDAERGWGLEVGGGLAYSHTMGLEIEAQGRYLLAHRETAFDEWGGSLTVKLDPGQAGRGPWLAFAPGWGAQGSRAARIWDGKGVFRAGGGAEAPESSPDRLALEMGWGLVTQVGWGRGGLLTPYAKLSKAESGVRGYELGIRLEMRDGVALGVAGRRSVRSGAAPEHEGLLYGRLHW